MEAVAEEEKPGTGVRDRRTHEFEAPDPDGGP